MALYFYIEDGAIYGGAQALPVKWRDKGDISGWSDAALRAEGWFPRVVVDNRIAGEQEIDSTAEIREGKEGVYVLQTLRSQPLLARPLEEVVAEFKQRLFAMYDEKAAERDYRDRDSVMLRAGYVGPYQKEGIAFALWVDACDQYGYAVLDNAKANGVVPTWEVFAASLPVLQW